MKSEPKQREALKNFLKTRRKGIQPSHVGLEPGSRRRVLGLRREELANLAGVSVTWYTWLEQGRDIKVSLETMARIAVALKLTPSDTSYLFQLADLEHPQYKKLIAGELTTPIDPIIQQTLNGFTSGPATLFNARFDCVACNHLSQLVFKWNQTNEPFSNNFLWIFYVSPLRQSLFTNWDEVKLGSVGLLRANYAQQLGNPDFESLINALLKKSKEFADLWNDHQTASLGPVTCSYKFPSLGVARGKSMRLNFPSLPHHTLVLHIPEDEKSARVFKKMGMRKTGVKLTRSLGNK